MSLCKTIMSSQVSEGKQCTSTDKIFYRRVTVCYPFWTTNPNTLIYCSSLVLYELSKHCYDLSPATPVCSRLPLPHSSKSSQGRSKQPTITRFTQSVDIEVYTVVIVVQTFTTHRNIHCPHTEIYTVQHVHNIHRQQLHSRCREVLLKAEDNIRHANQPARRSRDSVADRYLQKWTLKTSLLIDGPQERPRVRIPFITKMYCAVRKNRVWGERHLDTAVPEYFKTDTAVPGYFNGAYFCEWTLFFFFYLLSMISCFTSAKNYYYLSEIKVWVIFFILHLYFPLLSIPLENPNKTSVMNVDDWFIE